MGRYGSIHRIVDFIERVIPQRQNDFVHRIIKLLKTLDAAQEKNQRITLTAHAGTGVWLYYDGKAAFLILPAHKFIRVEVLKNGSTITQKITKTFKKAASAHGSSVMLGAKFPDYSQWRLTSPGIDILEKLINGLPSLIKGKGVVDRTHPRNFPGHIRQLALSEFKKAGSICPGAQGKTKRHKVDTDFQPIEFDHVLPHVHGGSNSALNVQVLCMECNRIKRASAR
jgi:HNH endonuclease